MREVVKSVRSAGSREQLYVDEVTELRRQLRFAVNHNEERAQQFQEVLSKKEEEWASTREMDADARARFVDASRLAQMSQGRAEMVESLLRVETRRKEDCERQMTGTSTTPSTTATAAWANPPRNGCAPSPART